MLVIISDLHLTDGSSGEIISDSAFRLFRNRLSDMAYDASWRCDGERCSECRDDSTCKKYYDPIQCLDIILLGDILDMIRSEKWNEALETIMPWTQPRQDEFFATVEKIVEGILRFNQSSFNILRGLSRDGDIQIPKVMRPASVAKKIEEKISDEASNEKVTVKVNIYYMVGNHDWFFYINDPRIVNVRNEVIDTLGLANEKDKPFPYYRKDCEAIEKIQDEHRVFAEHGDQFDKTNFQTPHRDASSVGDVVVIKLLNAIPSKIEKFLKNSPEKAGTDEEIESFIKQLREMDNLRPYTLAPVWITQVLKETKLDVRIVNNAIKDALHAVITDFVRNNMVSKDFMLKIKMWIARLFLGGNFNIMALGSLINHTSLKKDRVESYKKFALNMAEGKEKDFFVMGHTHYAEMVPLSTYEDENKIKRNKVYINTGTWRSVHLRGYGDSSFISHKTMAIAGFFRTDERKGRPFEFWTGSLSL